MKIIYSTGCIFACLIRVRKYIWRSVIFLYFYGKFLLVICFNKIKLK